MLSVGQLTAVAAFLASTAALPSTTVSINPCFKGSSAKNVAFVHRPSSSQPTSYRKAIIYSWDESDDVIPDFLDNEDLSVTRFPSTEDLRDKIGRDAGRIGSLARLAAAFSPAERRIELGDILGVDVVDVDADHIELQAVVPHQDACVALRVPVDFPHKCEGEGMEDCVLENLEELEREAEFRIGQHRLDGSNDPKLPVQYPIWWVAPESFGADMIAQCDNLLHTLNEPAYRQDVAAIAQRGLERSEEHIMGTDPPKILVASVIAVGPAGVLLRAEVFNDSHKSGETKNIPLAFGTTVEDVDGLWSAVLDTVGV